MSLVIRAVDRIKEEFGCTVVLIHHDGKEQGVRTQRTPRGAQAVTGAADSLIHIGPTNEGCKVHCEYVKDYKKFPDVSLAMKTLNFSADEYDTGAYLINGSDIAKDILPSVQKTLLAIIGDKTMRNRDILAICMHDPYNITEKTMNTHLK